MTLRDRLKDIQQQTSKPLNPREFRAAEDQAYQDLKTTIQTWPPWKKCRKTG